MLSTLATAGRREPFHHGSSTSFFASMPQQSSTILKKWINVSAKYERTGATLLFLANCKRANLIPDFLRKNRYPFQIQNQSQAKKFSRIQNEYNRKILKLLISDTHYRLHVLKNQIRKIEVEMQIVFSRSFLENFFLSQNHKMRNIFLSAHRNKEKKFMKLLSRLYPPDSFLQTQINNSKKIFAPKFVNCTDIYIPPNVIETLALGKSFAFPFSKLDKQKILVESISSLESGLMNFSQDLREKIRNEWINIFSQFIGKPIENSKQQRDLLQAQHVARQFLRHNKEISIIPADKGGAIVAIKNSEYIEKLENIFTDDKKYELIRKDPSRQILLKIQDLLKTWKNRRFITLKTFTNMYPSSSQLPRAYGFLKLHKIDKPIRPVVSSINAPEYFLSKFLNALLKPFMDQEYKYASKNSEQVANQLRALKVTPSDRIISLDIEQMYPSLPFDMIMDELVKLTSSPHYSASIPAEQILIAVRLLLNNMFFRFNNKCYRQKSGCPIGGPLSALFAEITIRALETSVLNALDVKFYSRYVDDLILVVHYLEIDLVFNAFNRYHPSIKFTLEQENQGILNYLDFTVYRMNDHILTAWFTKPISAGSLLNFRSSHPLSMKKAVIKNLTDRVVNLTSREFLPSLLPKIFLLLLRNTYPLSFITTIICDRLNFLANRSSRENTPDNRNSCNNFIVLPYVPQLHNKMCSFFKEKYNISVVNSILNKNKFVTHKKDSISKMQNINVVYQLSCKQCDAVYLGQTSRKLEQRVKEHQNNVRTIAERQNSVTLHRIQQNHEFDFLNPIILETDSKYYRRLVKETLHIKMHSKAINTMQEKNSFTKSYDPMIMRFIK